MRSNKRGERRWHDQIINNIWTSIADLYEEMVGFWWLLAAIIENRLMIIQTAIPPAFRTEETKTKIEECVREGEAIIKLIIQLDNYWNKVFEAGKNRDQFLIMRGKLEEVFNQLRQHMKKFFELTDEVWDEYEKWSKQQDLEKG